MVRKIICKGCGREFYTQIKSKKYCLYHLCGNRGYRKELSERAREARKDRVCKICSKVFTPTRSDGIYCSNACRQRAYRKSVTDNQVVTREHLLIRNGTESDCDLWEIIGRFSYVQNHRAKNTRWNQGAKGHFDALKSRGEFRPLKITDQWSNFDHWFRLR